MTNPKIEAAIRKLRADNAFAIACMPRDVISAVVEYERRVNEVIALTGRSLEVADRGVRRLGAYYPEWRRRYVSAHWGLIGRIRAMGIAI